jgi:hypothetical protein
VIGVFMAAFLVGVLWYIIEIGDAAVYREYMQDGADAATFAAAVYQARGMNIIALLNLIMAAVLAVLVALKVAQILLTIATAIVCVVTVGFGCTPMLKAEETLQSIISKVEKIVDAVLPALYVTESAVAVGMPWLAEAKAISVARDYAPTVNGGIMVGISLVPGHLTKFLGNLGNGEEEAGEDEEKPKIIEGKIICKGSEKLPGEWVSGCNCRSGNKNDIGEFKGCCSHHGGIKKTPSGENACTPDKEVKEDDPESENENAGVRWGLPVEDDEFSVLCAKAADDVVEIVFLPFTTFGIGETVKKYTADLVAGLVVTFQGYFCGAGGINLEGGFELFAKAACEDAGPGAQQEIDQHNQGASEDKKAGDFDKDKCLEKFKSVSGGLNLPGGSSVGKKVPKKVYEQATAGDKYFASWSFVWGDLSSQSNAGKGVDVAAWGKSKTGAPMFLSKYHFAKSEFYYEPKQEDADRSWEGLKEEAMWNMRWRARLRRTYLPSYKLAGAFAKQIDKLKEAVGDAALVDDVLGMLGDPAKQIESIDDLIGEQIGNLNEGIIH